MHPLLVRTADVEGEPWRNGGGVTRQLLARPSGDGWRCRVSVAEVARDGPFSAFVGVERWFAVLEGAGVVLSVDGSEHRCSADDAAALRFSGGADTRCRLIDGPTRDLNLMLRGVAGALVRVEPGATWPTQASECGLYATTPGTAVATATERRAVPAHALCWWSRPPAALAFDGAGWWLRVGGATADDGPTP